MLSISKSNSVVGLDIEAGSVAAAEVRLNGTRELTGSGILALGPGITREGEVGDVDALAGSLRDLFAREKLSKRVRIGIASQRVAVRTIQLPLITNAKELDSAVRFQAQEHIPIPLEQAVIDYEVVGHTEADGGERRMEVVVVAARRDMLTALIGAVRAAGLRPIGVDLSAFGMIRALASDTDLEAPIGAEAPVEDQGPVRLYCSLGDVTNIAIAREKVCLFTRISPFGIEGIAQRLAERRGLPLEQARELLVAVGLERPVETIEGDPETITATRETLSEGVSKLADQVRLSLDGYAAQVGVAPIIGVRACGPGATIPGLTDRLGRELGQPIEIARPRALSALGAAAARLTLSYGLALEA
jgi:type IV pilus assembly protein PilM